MNASRFARRPAVALLVVLHSIIIPIAAFAAQRVDLPADPPTVRTVRLEEVWRLGAEDDDVLLGLITGGVLDDDLNLLLVDHQLSHVLVVSPRGEVVATLGREGDGPGEVRQPHTAFVSDDRVGLVREYPARIVFVNRDGTPAGQISVGGESVDGGFHAVRRLCCRDGVLVAQLDRSTFDLDKDTASTRSALSVLGLDGDIKAELVTHQVDRGTRHIVLDEAAAWAEYAAWAFGPQGVVATTAERDAWAINERDLDGELVRVLHRPTEPRRRTTEEKEDAASLIRAAVATGSSTFDRKPLDTDPAIVDLAYAADGRLFVTTCHNAPERLQPGIAGRFDVISPAGEYLEELTVTLPGYDPAQDLVVFLDGTRFLILRNYEDAEKALYADFLSEEEKEELGDAEPLEVVLVRIPD